MEREGKVAGEEGGGGRTRGLGLEGPGLDPEETYPSVTHSRKPGEGVLERLLPRGRGVEGQGIVAG